MNPAGHRPSSSTDASSARISRSGWVWLVVLGWTVLAGVVLSGWVRGSDGPAVWVFREGDLRQPGFLERIEAILRSDLGLQHLYPWLLLGPHLGLVAWFFPLGRNRLWRNLLIHAVACAAFVVACQGAHLRTDLARRRLVMIRPDGAIAPGSAPTLDRLDSGRPGRPPSPPRFRWSLRSLLMDLLAYGAFSGLVHSFRFHHRLQERERRALQLESRLAQARLESLKAQLQPHFLFNSLNAVTALLRRDPRQAEATLVDLAELLRLSLSRSARTTAPLREELEFVRRFLAIQQTRFGGRLRVEVSVDPETLSARVPTLVLQPLVENAVRHGIEPSEIPGTVRISGFRESGRLVLVVEDDGVGLEASSAAGASGNAGTGIGLGNLRERLEALYGKDHRFGLEPRPPRGVRVRVELPWEEAMDSALEPSEAPGA